MWKWILCCAGLTTSAPNPQPARQAPYKARKLYPVDESSRDASFATFRKRLLAAIEKRDRRFILSSLSRDIQNTFGGNSGVDGFKEHWNFNARDSEFWAELRTAILLGCTRESKREFWAPYVFSRFPRGLDGYGYTYINGRNVNVRSRPDRSAPALAKLTYAIVALPSDRDESTEDWHNIVTPSGMKGFVFHKYPIDYRACFKKIRGRWRMTFFVAGD